MKSLQIGVSFFARFFGIYPNRNKFFSSLYQVSSALLLSASESFVAVYQNTFQQNYLHSMVIMQKATSLSA